MSLRTTFLSVRMWFSHSLKGNRAACFLSLNKTARALKDRFCIIQMNLQFPRGFCRAGKCYFLTGDLENARIMYLKGLELASYSDSHYSGGHDDPRFIECLAMLNQIQEVKTSLRSIPEFLRTPDDVRRSINGYLAVQSKCSCWREMYLALSRDYLLLHDTWSAELLLNRISPHMLPCFHDSTIYPFEVAAWDVEKLDIFGRRIRTSITAVTTIDPLSAKMKCHSTESLWRADYPWCHTTNKQGSRFPRHSHPTIIFQ